ncbi:winged helix-turn-helix domain-containing protein [Lysobacter sp. KIS68-7]|uniref:winged helix-turn-helix domain-containing protein n=1 Tax=Lysobacter sp. KIS68-7 TaxID=2904252 RepID=UPI001E2FC8F0|nr:winged helix-turn-helix domain-containing protein [Lysobacter sp. KIS68-7]UHQ20285.1 winged helix-turn-helix domain-containing protein [Lysobacter sp. KIS68-7]
MPDAPARHYRFEGYELDIRTRELRDVAGTVVPLTAKAFDTLRFLIEHRDRVMTKDELLTGVWPGRVVEENNLTQAIAALRRAFGTHAGEHRFIVTVPGQGYRFVAVCDTADADEGAHAQASLPWRRWALAAVACIALAAGAWWALRGRAPTVPAASTEATLAVLPFRSVSAGARDELLEDGLADTLINRMSRSTTLRVQSLASSRRFDNPTQDPLDAARQLGARYVVEGTVQREGDRVRVGSRLLDARDGRAVWSNTFDERADRVFLLQDRVADAMISALALHEHARSAPSPCDGANVEAYRAYLTGRYQLDRPSRERMRQAIASFRNAIDLDPTCARAYAGTAYAYRTLVMTGDAQPRAIFPLAKAAVERALAIDPNLAEAYSSQGFIRFWYDWDWSGSEASFKHALALNPSLAEAHLGYAHLLANMGRMQESAVHARQAMQLDPMSPLFNTLSAAFLSAGGHADEAKRALARAREVEPDFWIGLLINADARMRAGDSKGAVADLERARALCGDCSQVQASLGIAYVQAGRRADAQALLRHMEALARTDYLPATSIAAVRNALGDPDGALALLERAWADRDVRMPFLRADGNWDNLRATPRFVAIVERMRFPPGAARTFRNSATPEMR